jgi:hypothetical protein
MMWGAVRACAGKATRTWVDTAGEEARRRMPRLNAIDLPQVAWALAKLGYEPDAAWKQALLSRLSQLLTQLAPEGLTAALHACARLHALPGKELLRNLLDVSAMLSAALSGEAHRGLSSVVTYFVACHAKAGAA